MASKQNNNSEFFSGRLADIRENNLYRRLRQVRVEGPVAFVGDNKDDAVVHLCSNDYLGLAGDKRVTQAAARAITGRRRVSQCSSRLIAGNDPAIEELEAALAKHRKTESALVYPTGYSANLGAVTALASGKEWTIFSDELNHASIIDACRLSGAAIRVFRHNDADHLCELMAKERGKNLKNMVVTEGVFSMDGDLADLGTICKVAREGGAITVVDDAHGDFIFGDNFSGTPSKFGIKADVHVSSMSKGLGCFGGYVAANREVCELLVNTSRQFIYTSALPDHLCAAASAAIPIAKKGGLQKKLFGNISYFTEKMRKKGFAIARPAAAASQIIPIIVGDEKKALALSGELLKAGAFAQAVRYPTVKKGSARLRVSLTAMHRKDHLDRAIGAFEVAGRKAGMI